MIAKETVETEFRAIHDQISKFLEGEDGTPYREDVWCYERGEGGGVTRTWEDATLIEKGGVNFSAICGSSLPSAAGAELQLEPNTPFSATGVSLVIHPHNPYVPTIHMNIRYFEAGATWWFGGGIDLTPYYSSKGEVIAFHQHLKRLCDEIGESYEAYKKQCDEYFFLPHRGEMRGVGGVFFDHLHDDREKHFELARRLGRAFPDIYAPLIRANRDRAFEPHQREFQLLRRGRYAEFNLLYDRGTKFGLQSGGRTESILMSLPSTARWSYNWRPEPGSLEAEIVDTYFKPQPWADMDGAVELQK